MGIHPVILCGGVGARLWPASQEHRPKPFLPLLGARSLFKDTVLRMTGIAGGEAPVIVAGRRHVGLVNAQLAELGIAGTVLVEPQGRDSAPAVAAAAAWIAARDPDGIAAMVASDHHIPDAAAFRRAVEVAAEAAAAGRIVTFGVRPTEPATAYGYVEPGEPLAATPAIHALSRFVEKPGLEAAKGYLDAGYLWNSGNFVFGAATLMRELDRHAPEVARVAREAVETAAPAGGALALGAGFAAAPKISIDYAVMEKTDRAAVLPVEFAWSDVGAWDAVHAGAPRDGDGNAVFGDALLQDSRDSLVRTDGPLVVGVGLNRVGVVVEAGAVLVCDLDASQSVKTAVDRLKAAGRPEALPPAPPSLATLKDRFETWLFGSALPLWWTLGADHVAGGFREVLDARARPVVRPLRARVQARQAYSFAAAGGLGWPGPWRQATAHGLEFLRTRYRRADGLYRTLVAPDGAPLDDTAMVYDQAFVLLALAQAAEVMPDRAETFRAEAGALLEALRAARGHPAGGFSEPVGPSLFQADPQMHLLEAALAWEEAGGGAAWTGLADAQAELGLARLLDPACGAVKENFDADWRPAEGPLGRQVEPGHQFEWAWLLERWGRMRGRDDARAAARRLFAAGERGVDPGRGVAVDELTDDFAIADWTARLWPQTERLKAALILGETAAAAEAGRALMGYFEGLLPGLWRDKREADGRFRDEPAPASSLYHIVCAFSVLKAHP
jgi:mannose-1-phosphate guanylyltransferase/mannose-6-phosphate isomerase